MCRPHLWWGTQGTASAPLWDGSEGSVVGVISASDFIHTLRRLRSAISSGHNPMSEAEMDAHTVRSGVGEHTRRQGVGCRPGEVGMAMV
jgi:hypothetical protein